MVEMVKRMDRKAASLREQPQTVGGVSKPGLQVSRWTAGTPFIRAPEAVERNDEAIEKGDANARVAFASPGLP